MVWRRGRIDGEVEVCRCDGVDLGNSSGSQCGYLGCGSDRCGLDWKECFWLGEELRAGAGHESQAGMLEGTVLRSKRSTRAGKRSVQQSMTRTC